MAKIQVECFPEDELVFKGDFREALAVKLEVKNLSSDPLFFKLKTTAPQRYIVKPHRGQVTGNGTQDVTVTLLPFHFKKGKRFSDKFLLQACQVSNQNENYSKHDFWSMVPKEEQFQRKLRCTLEYEGGDGENEDKGSPSASENEEEVGSVAGLSVASEYSFGSSLDQDRLSVQSKTSSRSASLERRNLKKEIEELRVTNKALKVEVKSQKQKLEDLPVPKVTVSPLNEKAHEIQTQDAINPVHMFGFLFAALLVGVITGRFLI